jgi:hypothetical protein
MKKNKMKGPLKISFSKMCNIEKNVKSNVDE